MKAFSFRESFFFCDKLFNLKKKSKKKSSRSKILFPLILILLIGSCVAYLYFDIYKPIQRKKVVQHFLSERPANYTSVGIDVSHHQGKINWEKLFKKYQYDTIVQFVYCKATEGSDHLDREFQYNRSKLLELGIRNGAYHFFTFSSSPEDQAKHFLSQWKTNESDLPPVLDIEIEGPNDKEFLKSIKIWLDYVENETGRRPVIYTSKHFYETKFKTQFLDYKFWVAAYSDTSFKFDDRIIHWQYTDKAKLSGIKGNIDANVSVLFNELKKDEFIIDKF